MEYELRKVHYKRIFNYLSEYGSILKNIEKNRRENCRRVSIFVENSGEKLGSPPLRSANKSLPTSGGDAKSLVCQTRVHTHTRPAYWFPFEHVSRSSKQAGKHARLCAAKNLEDDFPAGILIVITPFHLRSIHRWEKRERKKRERKKREGNRRIGYWILE